MLNKSAQLIFRFFFGFIFISTLIWSGDSEARRSRNGIRLRRNVVWQEARRDFMKFMTDSRLGSPASLNIYQRALNEVKMINGTSLPFMEGGLALQNIATWQMVNAGDKLYKFEKCAPYQSAPILTCIRFHYHLNVASPFYNSWVMTHATTQYVARAIALKTLLAQKMPANEALAFADTITNFREINIWAYVMAMKHWDHMVKNWEHYAEYLDDVDSNQPIMFNDFLNDVETPAAVDYLGRPAEHDYSVIPYYNYWETFLNRNTKATALELAEVARQNHGHVTELMQLWRDPRDTDLKQFIRFVSDRYLSEAGAHDSLESGRIQNHPQYKVAAAALLAELNQELASEIQRRQNEKIKAETERKMTTFDRQKLEVEKMMSAVDTKISALHSLEKQKLSAIEKNDRRLANQIEAMMRQEVYGLKAECRLVARKLGGLIFRAETARPELVSSLQDKKEIYESWDRDSNYLR